MHTGSHLRREGPAGEGERKRGDVRLGARWTAGIGQLELQIDVNEESNGKGARQD